ncbi:hypothetical protein [Teichococcus oryzae]|uniref:Uncharacterized protein n=1 Tax=Teichococcus oryzae TaxID=1608942 RepID=A0A5B2TL30_9PROT|nr:hypothetical protein [Pseudoroseomonas oryzae]KAA2214884.1 hypothetical protein F0Q34_04175 [Pseudoroseomonas oryzae]
MTEKNADTGKPGRANEPGPQTSADTPMVKPSEPTPPPPATPPRQDPEEKPVPDKANKHYPQNHYANAAPEDPPPAHRK